MKIAILNHYASIPEFGSSETRHFEFAKRFVKDGHSVDIYVGDYSHLNSSKWSIKFNHAFEKDGVRFFVIKTRTYHGNGLDRFLASYDYFRNGKKLIAKQDYDFVIASSPHPFAWSLGWWYSRKKPSTKFFIEIRDVWPDDLVSLGTIKLFHPVAQFFDFMCKIYYSKVVGMITLMPDLSHHFERIGVKPKRVAYIPNGTEIESFLNPASCTKVDEIFNTLPSKKIVVYAGSIVPHNGIREFLELLNEVDESLRNNFVFLFIGPSQRDYLSQVKAIAPKDVFFYEPIPKSCIPYLFKKADLLLFTLSQTGMKDPAVSSYKILDYMASAKPVLSVDVERLAFKQTEGAIFYKNDSAKTLQSALKKILSVDIAALGDKNREFVLERSWNRLYEKLKSFLLQ